MAKFFDILIASSSASFERREQEGARQRFEQEKELLLASVREERRQLAEEKEKGLKEIQEMKRELDTQRNLVNKQKYMYLVHKAGGSALMLSYVITN